MEVVIRFVSFDLALVGVDSITQSLLAALFFRIGNGTRLQIGTSLEGTMNVVLKVLWGLTCQLSLLWRSFMTLGFRVFPRLNCFYNICFLQ